jgi:hypothetical protein
MEGVRVLRPSTVRRMTDTINGAQFDSVEYENLGKTLFFGDTWSFTGVNI